MYGVGALGNQGAYHTIDLIKTELTQVMEQVGCEKTIDLPKFISSK
jgi:L-lactate dehydrogenase (cytochrome)